MEHPPEHIIDAHVENIDQLTSLANAAGLPLVYLQGLQWQQLHDRNRIHACMEQLQKDSNHHIDLYMKLLGRNADPIAIMQFLDEKQNRQSHPVTCSLPVTLRELRKAGKQDAARDLAAAFDQARFSSPEDDIYFRTMVLGSADAELGLEAARVKKLPESGSWSGSVKGAWSSIIVDVLEQQGIDQARQILEKEVPTHFQRQLGAPIAWQEFLETDDDSKISDFDPILLHAITMVRQNRCNELKEFLRKEWQGLDYDSGGQMWGGNPIDTVYTRVVDLLLKRHQAQDALPLLEGVGGNDRLKWGTSDLIDLLVSELGDVVSIQRAAALSIVELQDVVRGVLSMRLESVEQQHIKYLTASMQFLREKGEQRTLAPLIEEREALEKLWALSASSTFRGMMTEIRSSLYKSLGIEKGDL